MIGGSGTGGLLAMLLGPLGLSMDQARDTYLRVIRRAFSPDNRLPNGLFDPVPLEDLLQNIVHEALGDKNARMIDPSRNDKCKAFVCLSSVANVAHPRILRTYRTRNNPSPNCCIWEAIRATLASPGLLASYEIKNQLPGETMVGGSFRWNNPAAIVLKEAHQEFSQRPLSCLVNLGTGHPGVIRASEDKPLEETLVAIVRDCDRAAEEMTKSAKQLVDQEREWRTRHGLPSPEKPRKEDPYLPNGPGAKGNPSFYFRFSVTQGMQKIGEADWERVSDIVTHTKQYLLEHESTTKVDEVVCGALQEKRVWITLGERKAPSPGERKTLNTSGYLPGGQKTPSSSGYSSGQRYTPYSSGYSTGHRYTPNSSGYSSGQRYTPNSSGYSPSPNS
ncbi:acyl transferase/acyl hydrolase/lysophospholipase [Flagelloscypha sp. PMI_526]|nr:acyl transferase/acyl hydrolase/lysophospholipase [Flagelloscypha sp. PMI_526]